MPTTPTLLLAALLLAPPTTGGTQPAGAPAEKAPQKEPEKAPDKPSAPKPPEPKPPTTVTDNDVLHVKPQQGLPRQKYTLFGEQFDCELCLNVDTRNAGMGARTEFPKGTAMIFVHTEPSMLSYWMKDCLIDMDMVMVDARGIICALHEAEREKLRTRDEPLQHYHDRLRRYGSNRRAQFVIEFPPGTVARLKPRLGQRVDIDWKALEARAE
jgi:uncharacterized membrane protein (UPF0127 family)